MDQHSSLLERLNSTQLLDSDDAEREDLYRRLTRLEPVVNLANELKRKEKVCEHAQCPPVALSVSVHTYYHWQEKCELESLTQHSEDELGELALEELSLCCEEIERLEASLINAVIPRDKADQHSAVLELRAGTAGHCSYSVCKLPYPGKMTYYQVLY